MNQPLRQTSPMSVELRQTADALRHCYQQVKSLLRHEHPVSGYQEAWRILADGPELADALDTIADRLEEK